MTHPLERLKRIADETIRKQAIENFDEKYYQSEKHLDKGFIHNAICLSFDWVETPEGQGFGYWSNIEHLALNNQLELLPEPIEDNKPVLVVGAENYSQTLETIISEQKSELEKVKLENEKLRECLKLGQSELYSIHSHYGDKQNAESHSGFLTQAKQLLKK